MPSPFAVQRALTGLLYPASKAEVIARATHNGAAPDLLSVLKDLPDREFDNAHAIGATLSCCEYKGHPGCMVPMSAATAIAGIDQAKHAKRRGFNIVVHPLPQVADVLAVARRWRS